MYNKSSHNLIFKLFSSGFMTLISRILGFIRDMMTANYFGSGLASDAFFVAFKIPNLLRRIFAEGAFSQAFVPVLMEYKRNNDEPGLKLFISNIFGLLLLALTLVTILGLIFSGFIIVVTSPGFSHNYGQFIQAQHLLKIMFPYILFISLCSFMGALLNSEGYFALPAFVPSILNLSFIIFTLYFKQYFDGITVLAWAVFVGGLLQLLCQIPLLIKLNLFVTPTFNYHHHGVKKVFKLMIPAIFAVSVAQIGLLINTAYASLLPTGSISYIYYADRVMEFPVGVFGVAMSNILLNNLSKNALNPEKFSKLLDWGIKLCLIIALPTSLGMGMLAEPIVKTLFYRGHFDLQASIMTANALIGYSIGFIGLLLVKIFAPAFYARQDIKTPVKIAVFVLICNQLLNFLLIPFFGSSGLTLAIGLSACLNSMMLFILLLRRNIYQPNFKFIPFILKLLFALLLMAITIKICMASLHYQFTDGFLKNFMHLTIIAASGLIVYIAAILGLGLTKHKT